MLLGKYLRTIWSVWSMVISVTDGTGVRESISRAMGLLTARPRSIALSFVLLLGIMAARSLFYSVQFSFSALPLMAPVVYFINIFFHAYLAIVLWSSLISFYIRHRREEAVLEFGRV